MQLEVPRIHFNEPFLRTNWLAAAAEIKRISDDRVVMVGSVAVAYGVYGIKGTDYKGLVSIQTDVKTGLMAAERHTTMSPDEALKYGESAMCVAHRTPARDALLNVEGMPHKSAGGALSDIAKIAIILCNHDTGRRRMDEMPFYKLFKLQQSGHKLASPELVEAINTVEGIEFPLLRPE